MDRICFQFPPPEEFGLWILSACDLMFSKSKSVVLCKGFKNGDGNSVQHDLLKGYLTIKQSWKTIAIILGLLLFQVIEHLLKLNWVFFVCQYLPKGVGLAAKGKQEMAWKLIKLAENSFCASDQIFQGPQLPLGYRNRKSGNRKRRYLFSSRADLQRI